MGDEISEGEKQGIPGVGFRGVQAEGTCIGPQGRVRAKRSPLVRFKNTYFGPEVLKYQRVT